MAEIVLRRPTGYRVDHQRAYRVFLDGQKVGKIGLGETKVFEVRPGMHQLQLKVDWCSSEKLEVNVDDNGRAVFLCRPRITENSVNLKVGFQGMYWGTLGRKQYIDLRPDKDQPESEDIGQKG